MIPEVPSNTFMATGVSSTAVAEIISAVALVLSGVYVGVEFRSPYKMRNSTQRLRQIPYAVQSQAFYVIPCEAGDCGECFSFVQSRFPVISPKHPHNYSDKSY